MRDHEYILENYLVNYAFKNIVPLGGKGIMYDTYVKMILHYSLVKMYLIGMAAFHKEKFNVKLVIMLISSFTMNIEHTLGYLDHIFNLLLKNDRTSMACMAVLIKN